VTLLSEANITGRIFDGSRDVGHHGKTALSDVADGDTSRRLRMESCEFAVVTCLSRRHIDEFSILSHQKAEATQLRS